MSIPERRPASVQARRSVLSLGALLLSQNAVAAEAQLTRESVLQAQRVAWMREGEAALAVLDTGKAELAFERAAAIEHRADAEISLVRAYLQAGEYRRGLAFVAHTSAAHKNDSGGAVLYAWLLNAMGQTAQAHRILAEAQQRLPNDTALEQVSKRLSLAAPSVTPVLLRPPLRLAPYGGLIPKAARVMGQGVLIDEGSRALVDATGLRRDRRLWVRNGLGQVSGAKLERRLAGTGFALVALERQALGSLPTRIAARPPFPGSIGHLVNFAAGDQLQPQWPLMHSGFIGTVRADQTRALGIEPAFRSNAGPVFDATGTLTGLSMFDRAGRQSMFTCSGHLPSNPVARASIAGSQVASSPPVEAIYEQALALAVQTLVA